MPQTSRNRPGLPLLAARDATLEAVWGYWDVRRGDRRCPARADLDPLDIPQLLPHLGLVDVEDDGRRFRYRLIGTHMNAMLGENFTGRCLDPENRGAYAALLQDLYADCTRARRPLFSENEVRYHDGRRVTMRRLILPFAGDDGAPVEMLLFSTTFHPHGADGAETTDYRWLEPPYLPDGDAEIRTLAHLLL